jgi:hypothetical protein
MSRGKREKAFRILTRGRWGRCDDYGVPASKSGGGSDEARRQRAWSEEGRKWRQAFMR